jgi:polar amino acid transport system substrate-binding protein
MKMSIVVIILILNMISKPLWAQDIVPPMPIIKLLTENNPPHSFVNPETGSIEGTSINIVKGLMHDVGLKYTLKLLPWNRAFRRAQAEKDVCVFPTNRTPNREQMFQWVSPTQVGGWAIYQRPDTDFHITQLEDIRPFTVVGKMGSPAAREIEDTIGKAIIRAANDEAAALLLYRGRADLWVAGTYNATNAAVSAGLPEPKITFSWKPALFGLACSLSTDKRLITLLNAANQARLAKLQANSDTAPRAQK